MITFRSRGMNDEGFKYLHDLIEKENIVCNRIDLSYNALTNSSVRFLFNLYEKTNKKLRFYIEHNPINIKKIANNEHKNFIEEIMKKDYSVNEISFTAMHLSPLSPSNDLQSSISQLIERSNLTEEQINRTAEQIQKTSETVEKLAQRIDETSRIVNQLTKNVETLRRTTSSHESIFNKMHKNIENKIKSHLMREYDLDEVTLDDMNGTDLANHEIDIILLSRDGKRLIIGEVKHELVNKAFSQLAARIETFETLQMEDLLPEKLRNVTAIVPLVGAEIIPPQLRSYIKKKQYVLVEPCLHGYFVQENAHRILSGQ